MVDKESTNIGSHALLITKDNKVILQQRDNNPEIVNPGMISMFGGSLHTGESKIEGLLRELSEELNQDFKSYDIQFLATFYKTKPVDGVDYTVHVYTINNVDVDKLQLNEGKGLVVDSAPNLLASKKLTRMTELALTKYLDKSKNQWVVYILLCKNNSLYTGTTNDLDHRLEVHRSGKGSKYVRANLPFKLIFTEQHPDKVSAMKREAEIKGWSRERKLRELGLGGL